MEQEQCINCKFSKPHELPKEVVLDVTAPKGNFCMRSPPQVTAVLTPNAVGQIVSSVQAVYPLMADDGWCGEFKPKLDA